MSGTGVAVFDPTAWVLAYPEFAAVDPAVAGQYFALATLYLSNDATSAVADVGQRGTLLGLITAHLASLSTRELVGRISNATEGSVSVQTEMGVPSNSSAFWMQTRYGAMYWQATANLRTMRYVPGPLAQRPRFPGFYGPSRGGW